MKILPFLLLFIPFLLIAQEKGNAGVYNNDLQGRKTASGQKYNKSSFTASHKSLDFGTWIRVKRVDTGQTVDVKVNDRGPYTGNRIIDISAAAGQKLALDQGEITVVEIEVLGKNHTPTSKTEVMPLFNKRAKETKKALNQKQESIQNVEKPKAQSSSLTKNKPFISNLIGVNLYNVPKKGHAIQIGIFSSFENVYLQISSLPKSFQKNTIILPFKKNGKLIYKLLIGPYLDKPHAQKIQKKMRKYVKDCIVVDLMGMS